MPVKEAFRKAYDGSMERTLQGLPPANRCEALGRALARIIY